jgi:acyl carrier protein
MTSESQAVLDRVATVMQRTFRSGSIAISARTTSADVAGWDSLSHALLIMGIEQEFGIVLPFEEVYALNNVGELVELISRVGPSPAGPGK